ncbi:unnamed protein product [Moneuplotes crassus]|uniref:Uncharacterized protein n=1 Tax=Euplotes crassus TaxID=5936 RepID=A0AAD1Y496_EUPCR|nr:unnamed protein product [Moneuplotes crassus]
MNDQTPKDLTQEVESNKPFIDLRFVRDLNTPESRQLTEKAMMSTRGELYSNFNSPTSDTLSFFNSKPKNDKTQGGLKQKYLNHKAKELGKQFPKGFSDFIKVAPKSHKIIQYNQTLNLAKISKKDKSSKKNVGKLSNLKSLRQNNAVIKKIPKRNKPTKEIHASKVVKSSLLLLTSDQIHQHHANGVGKSQFHLERDKPSLFEKATSGLLFNPKSGKKPYVSQSPRKLNPEEKRKLISEKKMLRWKERDRIMKKKYKHERKKMVKECDSLRYFQYHTVRASQSKKKLPLSPMFLNEPIFKYLRDTQSPSHRDFYMTPSEKGARSHWKKLEPKIETPKQNLCLFLKKLNKEKIYQTLKDIEKSCNGIDALPDESNFISKYDLLSHISKDHDKIDQISEALDIDMIKSMILKKKKEKAQKDYLKFLKDSEADLTVFEETKLPHKQSKTQNPTFKRNRIRPSRKAYSTFRKQEVATKQDKLFSARKRLWAKSNDKIRPDLPLLETAPKSITCLIEDCNSFLAS